MADDKNGPWFSPENLRRQERDEIEAAEKDVLGPRGHVGAYWALLARGDLRPVRDHALVDAEPARLYARQIAQAAREAAPLPPVPDLLDAGCGPGAVTDALREQFDGCRAVGLDISETAIAYAARHFPDCRFEAVGIEEGSRLGGPYDLIHAREFYAFTRTGDPDIHRRTLLLLGRHLKPGGLLAIVLLSKPPSLLDTIGTLSADLRAHKLAVLPPQAIASAGLARILPRQLAVGLTRAVKAALGRPPVALVLIQRLP